VVGPWQFVTCEYPPAIGGVSDFSRNLARALARRGEEVHVWAPAAADADEDVGVMAHSIGGFDAQGIARLAGGISAQPGEGALFIHWVPHGYGARAMNLPFCRWVRQESAGGRRVVLMVHEPFLPLPPRRIRHLPVALVQRRMMRILLGCAWRVCVSTTSWIPKLRPLGLHGDHAVVDLPTASSVAPIDLPPGEIAGLATRLKGSRACLVGHFGTFSGGPAPLLSDVARSIVRRSPDAVLLLIGRDSGKAAMQICRTAGLPAGTIVGSGTLTGPRLSAFVQACDLFVQPYEDGVTTRRSTIATLLAHGAAVVTTAGSLTEAEWNGESAPVVTAAVDGEALAKAVGQLAADAGRRAELSRRARAAYAARFDIDRTADRLLIA
jgi:glycosyltransferase involved in cell wall biosynthesis